MATWRNVADAMQIAINPGAQAAMVGVIPGSAIRCYIGRPDPNTLNADLRASIPTPHVTIISVAGSRLTSRYGKEPSVTKLNPTETVTVNGLTITIGGTLTVGDNVFARVNYVNASTTVQSSDSLSAIATRLATAITALGLSGITASANGAVVTLSGGVFSLTATTCGIGTTLSEVSRITRRFQVSVWTYDDVSREAIDNAVLQALAGAEFLSIAETSSVNSLSRILFENAMIVDEGMVSNIMRSESFWQVEYPVQVAAAAARVAAMNLTLSTLTPMQQVLSAPATPITLSSPTVSLTSSVAQTVAWAEDLSNGLTGAIPGNRFTTSQLPVPGTIAVYVNGLRLRLNFGNNTGPNTATVVGQVITTWRALTSSDYICVSYEI